MKASIIMVSWSPREERMKLLKQTLDSLQEDTEHELIVVDNGPEEQTDYLRTIKVDKHIVVGMNKGIGYGWNLGLKNSSGEFISLIDNDLIFQKGWLKDCIEMLEKYPREKLVATSCISAHQLDPKYFLGTLDNHTLWSRSCTAGTVFRRGLVDDIGLWGIHPKPGTKWCDNLTRKGYKFIALDFPKVAHRGYDTTNNHVELMKEGKWRKEWEV